MADPILPIQPSKYVDVQDEASDGSVLLEATREGVAVVLLNRPHQRNSLGARAVEALTEAFQSLQGAEGVRLVLIRGAGHAFSAGGDLGWLMEMSELTEEDNRLDALDVAHMLKALHDLPALTVALVEGAAVGLGAAIVAACDSAIATEGASFSFPEVKRGLTAAVAAPYVIEAVGPRQARRLLASGATIRASDALRIGLVDEVVANVDGLNAAQDRLATEVLDCAPAAMDEAKRLVREWARQPIERPLIEDSARRLARSRLGPEAQEALDAVRNRRKPGWVR